WLIHSENYQALNTLQDKFKQKIQTIYIDPPYNTGSDGFIYSDKFQNSSWLSFMQDRLDFSKIFLNETGSLFVSIGDTIKSGHVVNSNSKMQLLMSQIFGEQNYIANFIRRSSSAPKLDAKHISNAHDYVVAYAKNINDLHLNKKLANLDRFTEIDFHIKSRGKYALNKLDRGSLEYSKSLDFAIISPENTEIWPNGTEDDIRWIWRWSKDKIQWGIENDYIVFKKSKNNKWQVYYKEYELVDNELNIRERENPYHTFIDGFFNEFGNKEIEDLFQLRLFEYPKPSNLVKYILEIASQTNSFILDFFAGSGTTAHATIELNKKDGGTRKYLLIEMGEHFDKVIVPRLKKVCFSDQWKDGKAQPKGKGVSQFFKYFSLEQYEETLALSKYEDKNPLPDNIYSQYLFFKDLKLAPLAFENDSAEFRVDLRSLHPKIDIAETLSHLLGKMIAKINKDSVVFSDGTVIDLENLDYKYIKRLIWW
ncbi:MAG: site-specific DNA-methyltransferase, partial [Bacteroidetes bacterium]